MESENLVASWIKKEDTNKIYISDLNSLIINNNIKYNKILKSWTILIKKLELNYYID